MNQTQSLEQTLEDTIKEMMFNIYDKAYIAKLKVTILRSSYNDEPYGYKLTLDMNNQERPLVLSYAGDCDSFLKFLDKEFRTRHLGQVHYFTGIKNYTR